jgi:hypothetical protein
VYGENERLNIDSNTVENAIRLIAIGRKIGCSATAKKALKRARCFTALSRQQNQMI